MFDIDSKGIVVIKPEFLLVKEFKDLWESDKLDKIHKLFAYIYFKYDFKSPYRNSYEEEELEERLLKDVLQVTSWKPSDLVQKAETKYQELQQTKSLKTLQSAENALTQISYYFNDFDINSIPEASKHQAVNNMMRNLKELDDVIGKIESARKRVESELISRSSGKRKLRKRELPKSQR